MRVAFTVLLAVLAGRAAAAAVVPPVEGRDSLATAGDFVHTELTPAGQGIASNLYALLERPDGPERRAVCAALAARAAAFDPDRLANRETIALGWLLERMSEEPAARKFAQDRVADEAVGILDDIRLHRIAFLRRRLQKAHVADADH